MKKKMSILLLASVMSFGLKGMDSSGNQEFMSFDMPKTDSANEDMFTIDIELLIQKLKGCIEFDGTMPNSVADLTYELTRSRESINKSLMKHYKKSEKTDTDKAFIKIVKLFNIVYSDIHLGASNLMMDKEKRKNNDYV